MFIVVMYYNDCPRNGNGADCMGRSVLRRFSFQPLKENPLFGPSSATLVKYGGLDRYKVVHGNQAWRLETSTCLHAGLIYLGANMISLIFVGVRLEQQFGFCKPPNHTRPMTRSRTTRSRTACAHALLFLLIL